VITTGNIISLDKLAGIQKHDATTATVSAGTRLGQFSRQLDERKLALRNLPDIDQQTIAGALATGTHGTGLNLPALHEDALELRLITPTGKVIVCNEGAPQLLEAARVSLGSLGIISEVKMRVVPAYNLQRKVWLRPVEEMLAMSNDLAKKHRHFEFYYLPFTGFAAAITHDIYQGSDVVMPPSQDEQMLRDLRRLRDWAGKVPSLRRWLARKLIDPTLEEHAKNRSFKLLSTARPTVFNEAECHVPQGVGLDCVKEIIAKLEERNEVFFPLEFRFVRSDNAWLSPFYKRDSCSIAVHAAKGEPYDYLMHELGPIFRKYEGRPHWGKLHGFSSKELAKLYPRWYDFQQVRRSLDPQDRMLNPHLRQIFGIPA
jgi:FAD-linked oxidoreductase